jgi:hypothetical protein
MTACRPTAPGFAGTARGIYKVTRPMAHPVPA